MHKCQSCKHQNAPNAQFCESCGAQLTEEPGHTTQMYSASDLAHEMDSKNEGILKGSGPRLVVLQGAASGSKFALTEAETTLGRHTSSDVFLDDVTVSRHHAEIQKENGGYMLLDKGSLNGTYVNKQRVESVLLNSGDEVQVGKFKFLYLNEDI